MQYFKIGKNSRVDKGVILGYKPQRAIKIKKTIIGDNARIRTNSVIYTNTSIGDGLDTGHNVLIREENKIGDNFKIWSNSIVDYGCLIGSNVKIHSNVYVAQFTIIEDDVFIAPGVMIANDLHPICGKCMKGPTIKKNAVIGINSTLLPDITIGENSFIGAGSVVIKDVPGDSVVAGNPARIIGKRSRIKCKKGIKRLAYGKI